VSYDSTLFSFQNLLLALNNMSVDKYRIGKTHISITSLQNTIENIENAVKNSDTKQICISDFRSVCYASDNEEYNKIMDSSYMNAPDGMPLIWMARLWGLKEVHRTMGPELFVNMLKKNDNGLKHFLIGDTDEVLEQIKFKFTQEYNSLIAGAYSPPFVEVNQFNYTYIAKMINDSGADLVWISMTAPKQDYFASNILPFLNKKILIGVGAAFRYSIGAYKIPGGFANKIGLTGFFMRKKSLKQFEWYLIHICRLIIFSAQIIYGRFTGKKYYE
jgi:N-acetylglucosaminyldiphosphoundecaprenol N-acetyl-beta-D-mannosaminyltransferase